MEKKTAPQRKKSGAHQTRKVTKILKEKRKVTTNKTATKKSWRKPKLTVLVRGKPEEMVLAAGCKRATTGGGPSGVTNACVVDNCNLLAGS